MLPSLPNWYLGAVPTHLRVFLASPGDVLEERHGVFEVLARLQYAPFLRGRVTFECVAWDAPFSSVPLSATIDPLTAIA